MDTPQISIVVPVYNSAIYLRDCVNSILMQSFSDFELILVNDGSSDESGAICDQLALVDKRIRVYHKENGGSTSARRYGVERANGKWIMFVDSDDTIPQDSILDLFNHDDGDTDIIAGTILYKSRKKLIKTGTDSKKIDNKEYIHYLLNRQSYYGPCSKLIKIELFHDFYWNADYKIFQNEDLLMLLQLASRTKKPITLSNSFVHYVCVDKIGSMSTLSQSYEVWEMLFGEVRDCVLNISEKYSGLYADYVNYVLLTIYDCLLTQAINVPNDIYIRELINDAQKVSINPQNIKVLNLMENSFNRTLFCYYRKLRMTTRRVLNYLAS